MLPALVRRELRTIARDHHARHPDGAAADRIERWLGALIPRMMFPGSLAAAARQAGAEPLWTGRRRAYADSTLRQAADRLDAEGASALVAKAVWRRVQVATSQADDEVIAYTDMFDQPYYTKKLAHAAPIGRLGNRMLAASYFGLTTIALPQGPTLFAHLSWHKPAAPLRDALEDLFDDDARLNWWHSNVRLHIVDRGANGDPVLRWLGALEVPYLTIGHKSAELWRFRAPTVRNDNGQPIVVRPDGRLESCAEEGPWEVIVPADPDDPDGTRAIRFRSAVAFTEAELLALNVVYKSRWPSMENEIKALQSRGFGRNRTRRLELTVNRGTEGELARLQEREDKLISKAKELGAGRVSGKTFERIVKTVKEVRKVQAKQATVRTSAPIKNARPEGGGERLGKWLHLLVHNALALALYTSVVEDVRTMSPAMVFELLLGRAALTCLSPGRLTMWVDALDAAEDRRRQEALVEVFNKLRLWCQERLVVIRLRERPPEPAS